ncbi:MAG: putative toxin-antitoxin system toxin component, PIN family [Chlamydiae bacterium]|nr:MAG: putative toxin-antitoxin system toxin component, PIN family [Chlamydiota bacterium]
MRIQNLKNVVLDTNVFVSALFSNQGASFKILNLLLNLAEKKVIINNVSVATILELEDVIFRQKNRDKYLYLNDNDLKLFIDDIVLISNKVKINYLWRPFLKDSGDDKIFETAFNGNAEYIITHNIKDFKNVKEKFGIDVITPKQYLKIIGDIK